MLGVLICLICLTACSGKHDKGASIVGEWIVDSYIDDGEIISPDVLGEYIGVDNAPRYNNRKFTFFDDGTFVLNWMDDAYGYYTIADSTLKLSDGEGDYLLLSIQDNLILMDETERIGLVSRYKKN